MKKITLFLTIILFSVSLFPQVETGKYSNEFLNLGIGARGLAMANTLTSLTDDITATYWNPSGLTRMNKKYQLALMHAEYFAGLAKYDYVSIAYKADEHLSLAFSYIRFGVDNIMNTTELIDNQGNIDYDRISYFSVADHAFLLSAAYQFKQIQGLSLGANAKLIRRRTGDFGGAWGFGLDAGLQYVRKGWQFGAMFKDITGTFNAWSFNLSDQVKEILLQTGNELPSNGVELTLPKFSLGASKRAEFGKGFAGTFALDFDFFFDGKRNGIISSKAGTMDPHFGMEFDYKKIVFIRTGVGNFQKESDFDNKQRVSCQVNLGLGFSIKDIVTIDYAFTDIGDFSIAQYSHIFSLKIGINSFKKKLSQ
jgi:hypothetical protein